MVIKERQNRIVEYLKEHSSATVFDMSEALYASPSTIRRDLVELERFGLIQRYHGGAVVIQDAQTGVFSHVRAGLQIEEKNKVAEIASRFLKPSTSYFFDASTTCLPLAQRLCAYRDVSVTTNGIEAMAILSAAEDINITLTGGVYSPQYKYVSGSLTLDAISKRHADIFFFSCAGFSMDFGVSDHRDVTYKRAFWKNSDLHILLVGSSKFDKTFNCQCFDVSELDYVITDKKPDNPAYEKYFGDKLIYS